MSPILFYLFVEDLELFLQDSVNSGLNIDDIVLIMLLFADDMAILGKTTTEVQHHFDLLYTYCNNGVLKLTLIKPKLWYFVSAGVCYRTKAGPIMAKPSTSLIILID